MSNHYSLNILAADDSGLTRIVRKSPLSSAAIMKALTSILFSLCIIPTNVISMEIIQLDDQELTLYWCVPEGNIGGCDTATYRSEVWKPRPPKRKETIPFYLKRPDK